MKKSEIKKGIETIQRFQYLEESELRELFKAIYPGQTPATVMNMLTRNIIKHCEEIGYTQEKISKLYFPRCRKSKFPYLAKNGKTYQGVIVFDNIVYFWDETKRYHVIVDGEKKYIRFNARDKKSPITAFCSYLVK